MVAQHSEFFKISQNIAEQFLQTAVIIDDRAEYSSPENEISSKVIRPPKRRSAIRDITTSNEAVSSDIVSDKSHFLNAKTITDQFAQKGIICSILKPINKRELDSVKETFNRLASSADIIILDWQLHNDDGDFAKDVIGQIAQDSSNSSKKLRLVTIYTGEKDILGVAEKVKTFLKAKNLEAHLHESAPTLTIDAIQVIVLAKKATGIMPHLKSYEVDFSELANKVTQEFTNMTAGLISNAVLLSLTKIRQNTFKIINNFSKDLDAPFLTHRALQVDPRDAEEHLTGLIAEEIQAILEEAQIGQETTKLEMVKLWLESTDFKIPSTEMYLPVAAIKQLRNVNNPQGIEKIKKYIANQQDISEEHKNQLSDLLDIEYDDINELTRHLVSWVDAHSELSNFLESKKSDIISLLEDGIQAWETKPKGLREQNSHTFQFTKLFTNSPRDPFDLDEQFALTSSTRSFYGDDTRKLTLGTIVKRDLQYLVCVQPKCDTYRLTEPRVFLFLPLSLAKEETFNFVVKDNGKYKRLILEKKPYQLVLLEFEPTKERQIVTTQNGKYTATDGAMYEWIAELRFEHAQRISNRLATDLSRVGVNESQWLRRWAKE